MAAAHQLNAKYVFTLPIYYKQGIVKAFGLKKLTCFALNCSVIKEKLKQEHLEEVQGAIDAFT